MYLRSLSPVTNLLLVAFVAFEYVAKSPYIFVSAKEANNNDQSKVSQIKTSQTLTQDMQLDEPLEFSKTQSVLQDKHTDYMENTATVEDIIVRFSLPSVAECSSGEYTSNTCANQSARIKAQQLDAIQRLKQVDPNLEVTASMQILSNAVFLRVNTSCIPDLNQDVDVIHIAPDGTYTAFLSDTVPQIGASAIQSMGVTGAGVTVAVIDSGIDYTHANLGGNGTAEAYEAAYGTSINDTRNTVRDGLFPTEKVVDGYDFVGEIWPDGPLQEDDDPIDIQGHGTHVADIIGGKNGVAPGVKLYGLKVCSSLGSACSGIAIMRALEFSMDPNGDGDLSDHVDIINLSLGQSYNQPFDDDVSHAIESATLLGVLTVASAGNCGDNPYCTGSPASAKTAVSVAQTTSSSVKIQYITVGNLSYASIHQLWSPSPTNVTTAEIQYGDGNGGNLLGCQNFTERSLEGKIVLIDRGNCTFSNKIRNVGVAGGLVGIIGLVDFGKPFAGAFGGGSINIPGFMISQEDSNAIKSAIASGSAMGSVDPANFLLFSGSTASTTARGPDTSFNHIKPEIGAPGTSVSAQAGTGNEETNFGGTSGAAPMVTGAAALLKQSCPGCTPLALKSLMVNHGNRNIMSDTTNEVAPITRIGGGEVQVGASINATFWAYSPDDDQPSLSLGLLDATQDITITRQIQLINLSQQKQTIKILSNIRSSFGGTAEGAIDIKHNSEVIVPACGEYAFNIEFNIKADRLPANFMNSGNKAMNPASLMANEFDGYIVMVTESDEVALPWHILARKAASVHASPESINSESETIVELKNDGAGKAQYSSFSIVSTSDEQERGVAGSEMPTPDLRAIGVNTIESNSTGSICKSFLWEFAFTTWDRQTHLSPVGHFVYLDVDKDGVEDFIVSNEEIGNDDIRQISLVRDAKTGDASANFFAEHGTNAKNTVLRFCGEQIGMTLEAAKSGASVDAYVRTLDNFFGGPGDTTGNFTITPFKERFSALVFDGDTEPRNSGQLIIYDKGSYEYNTQEHGLMLFTNAGRGDGNQGAATEDKEALLFIAPDANQPKPLMIASMESPTPKILRSKEGNVKGSGKVHGRHDKREGTICKKHGKNNKLRG